MSRKFGEPRSSDELKTEASHHRQLHQHKAVRETIRGTPRSEGHDD